MLLRMLHDTRSHSLVGVPRRRLQPGLARPSPQEICKTAKLSPNARPRNVHGADAEALYKAIQATKIMAPPSNCISPIGEKAILHGLYKQIKGEFYTAVTRPPAVYRGNPFVIEAGLAFGKGPDQAAAATPEAPAVPLAEGEEREDDNELARVIRYANRVPLLYQQSACATFKAALETAWRNYGVAQSRGALPAGPMVIFVHMASVWVPFTSESKEAIADYDEIRKEIKLALQECGRRLGMFLRRRERAKSEFRRRNIFELYIEEVVEACAPAEGRQAAQGEAQGPAPEDRAEADRRRPAPTRSWATSAARKASPTRSSSPPTGPRGRRRCCPAPSRPRSRRPRSRGRGRPSPRRAREGQGQGQAPARPSPLAPPGHPPGKPAAWQTDQGGEAQGEGAKAQEEIERAMARAKAKKTRAGAVEKKLISVADAVITAAERSKDPTLSIPVRSLANVNFNEKRGIIEMGKRKQARTFFNVGMAKKFMQTVLVADALSELQRADLTTSLREIYYRTKHTMKGSHENTFDSQNESDPLIEDLEVSLAALREELHVRAENAGSIVGPRRVRRRRRPGGLRAPGQGRLLGAVHRRARVHRDPPLHRRLRPARREGHPVEPPLGGQVLAPLQLRPPHRQRPAAPRRPAPGPPPARGVQDPRLRPRRQRPLGLLHLLGRQAGLDQPRVRERADGHSQGQVHRPLQRRPRPLRPPRNVGIKLNDKDIGRAKELLKYRWFQKKPWQEEIKRMLASGLKYELDALANKDFRYLTKTYLPRKLKEEDWLD